jgi:hypothetical protein
MARVDLACRLGITGGRTWYGDHHGGRQQLQDGAAYFAWVVPMWGNKQEGEVNHNTVAMAGQAGQDPFEFPIGDRRRLPISGSFTLHHVLALVNYQTSQASVTYPLMAGTPDLTHHVGVAMGTGLFGDHYVYQQIAELEWELDESGGATDHMVHLVDRLGFPEEIFTTAAVRGPGWFWEVMAIPILTNITEGPGYAPQGLPWYVGEALGGESGGSPAGPFARSDVGGVAPGAPLTAGAEQFIEVRWQITPTIGDFDSACNAQSDGLYMGFGGGAVVLIGKMHVG